VVTRSSGSSASAPPTAGAWGLAIPRLPSTTRRAAVLPPPYRPDLRRALALSAGGRTDSTYALAHAGVARLTRSAPTTRAPPAQAYGDPRRCNARSRSIQICQRLYAALGNVHFNYDRDWASAEAAYKKATTLSPNFAEGFHWYSIFLAAQGRHPESSHAIQHAYERSPVSLPTLAGRARNLYFARDYEASIDAYRQLLRHDSTYVTAYIGLGMSLVQAGRPDDAIAAYQRAARLLGGKAPILSALLGHVHALAGRTAEARGELTALEAAARVRYVPIEYHALIHIGLGEAGAALAALEQAFSSRSGGIAYLRVEPVLDPIRGEPRFASLLRRAGLD
jgi:serine/threonine-protein kinase